MTQKGTHTWDIVIQYHRCPSCGFITESREDYHYQMGKWLKQVECGRCGAITTYEQKLKPKFGPLIGTPQPPEFDWE